MFYLSSVRICRLSRSYLSFALESTVCLCSVSRLSVVCLPSVCRLPVSLYLACVVCFSSVSRLPLFFLSSVIRLSATCLSSVTRLSLCLSLVCLSSICRLRLVRLRLVCSMPVCGLTATYQKNLASICFLTVVCPSLYDLGTERSLKIRSTKYGEKHKRIPKKFDK